VGPEALLTGRLARHAAEVEVQTTVSHASKAADRCRGQ
jgi:hypothetical protein